MMAVMELMVIIAIQITTAHMVITAICGQATLSVYLVQGDPFLVMFPTYYRGKSVNIVINIAQPWITPVQSIIRGGL